MLPAIRPATGAKWARAAVSGDDNEGKDEDDDESEEHENSGDWDDQDSRAHTAARPKTGVNFINVDDGSNHDESHDAWGRPESSESANRGVGREATGSKHGRSPPGWVKLSQRPATQGGKNGHFISAVPDYSRVKSALKRERSVLKTPGVKVFRLQDTTYDVNAEGCASLSLKRLTRTAHGAGYQQQKKLVAVPLTRKKRPATTTEGEAEPKVLPEHLQVRWRLLTSIDERRDFAKFYSTRYKERGVMDWKMEDVFSFVADSFINDTQVDVAGILVPKKLIREDGMRSDRCLDVLVLRQVKEERMDGKKLMSRVKHQQLAKTLKLETVDPTLADTLSTAASDYFRLNARKKVPQFEGITAHQSFEAVQADNTDEARMQNLMLREIELRKDRAHLKDLRDKLAPLQKKFAQGVDDFQSLEQHYDRLKTPDVRAFVQPKSRRVILSLKQTVDEDLTWHQGKWLALKRDEQALASAVREEEMQVLALRQQVESAQLLREARRKQMWDDQLHRATELELERDETLQKADRMMKECEDMMTHAANTVQTQFDRGQRNELLRMVGDKLFQARKICVEACRYQYRQKRLEAVESALEFAIEKLRDGDVHLSKIQANLVSAAAVENSALHSEVQCLALLKDSREHLQKAKRDYRRTGAVSMVAPNLQDFEESLSALEARIATITESKRKDDLDAKAASEAAAAAAAAAEDTDEAIDAESSADEEEFSEFERTLDRLIQEKQRQALSRVQDSLCGMQQWLFEVKSKSDKAQKAASRTEDSSISASKSQSSTRPASPRSPWASNHALPSVTVDSRS